jgi:hypothetical protein
MQYFNPMKKTDTSLYVETVSGGWCCSFFPSFSSTVELDQERITENIRVDTLTFDGGENHLFAFSHFSDFHSFIPQIIWKCSSLTYSKDKDMKWLIK